MIVLNRLRQNKLGWKLSLLMASTTLTLIVLEFTFRVCGICGEYHRPRVDRVFPIEGMTVNRVPYGFYTNSITVSQYDSDPRGYFEPQYTISHQHNSVVWRDIEHPLNKPANVFRILGLGDSYLWGQGVKRQDICLTQLSGLLQETMPNKRIETINAGLSAMNTVDQRDLLKTQGLAYDPDLVIVHFVLNDVEQDVFRQGPKIEFFAEYSGIYHSSDWLSDVSYVWSWGRQRFLNSVRAERYIKSCVASFRDDSPGWRACRDALLDIKLICERADVHFCVIVFPFFHKLDSDYPFQAIHEIVTEFCRSQAIHVLDLRDHYRSFHGPELWVHPADQHPNEIAHRIAGRAIAQFLKDNAEELLFTSDE